jgi:hypothetical protein
MKRIFFLLAVLVTTSVSVRAQDAATQEQLDKLRGEISTLQASNVELQKRLGDMQKDMATLRELATKPSGNYAAAEDTKRLADAIKEVDRKRGEDREYIIKQFKTFADPGKPPRPIAHTEDTGPGSAAPEKGYEYVIQSGDTISAILTAYRNKGVKVSEKDLMKANPGLKAESLKVGQKIFVPAPAK